MAKKNVLVSIDEDCHPAIADKLQIDMEMTLSEFTDLRYKEYLGWIDPMPIFEQRQRAVRQKRKSRK